MISHQPHRRWYRLTPDRLLIGLLAVEGFLFLSERYEWFAFNEHKGWTVLIAVTAVGATVLLLLLWLVIALLLRRRFQFSVRSLLILVAAVAVPCSWMTVAMRQARKQRDVVKWIVGNAGAERTGADWGEWVEYDWQVDANGDPLLNAQPPGPAWLRNLLGDDFFGEVVVVQVLLLGTEHTNTGLEHLKGLTQVRVLNFVGTQVTDVGLEHLKGLNQLQRLYLNNSQVTDAGLERLKGLTELQLLWLQDTQVTDVGLQHLEGLAKLQWLELGNTKVTDAGLQHLKGLSQLRVLDLGGTRVTNEGVKELRQALPNCKITGCGPSRPKGCQAP